MNYRKFGNITPDVSALGFGAMRFPCLSDNKVDEKEAIRMLRYAVDNGVNYIDTAYFYHDGESEKIVGKALRDGYRSKAKIATKSPTPNIEKADDFDRILEEQLRRLDTEYIDYYLLHTLSLNLWQNVVLKFDLLDKLKRAQKQGKIGHIGFSFHDSGFDKFKPIVDGFDHWDFCQIQLNYLDTKNQAGIKGLQYASKKGLGVVIMEPLLGGKLANPPASIQAVMGNTKSPVELALDFLWDLPEVSLILSGMSTMQQVKDNIAYAENSSIHMLNPQEHKIIEMVQQEYLNLKQIPCTKCEYCIPCPFGVEIPKVFEAYNLSATSDKTNAAAFYTNIAGQANLCKACKKCERICPQKINISEKMKEIDYFFKEN